MPRKNTMTLRSAQTPIRYRRSELSTREYRRFSQHRYRWWCQYLARPANPANRHCCGANSLHYLADHRPTEPGRSSHSAAGPVVCFGHRALETDFRRCRDRLSYCDPVRVLLTRGPFRRFSGPVIAVANIGQAAPAIGLVVLLAFWLGFGFWAAIVALVLYSVLPVLRNTMIGLGQVDGRLIEAARGMGMTPLSVLLRIELPLAVPVMLAGIRTALVLLVGTATLAAFVNGGGLGLLITTGVNLYLQRVLISGALLVALLALTIDWLARVVEQAVTPKGLR
uniref:Putative ABC transporter permease n=1 Tax=Renibacterium salmoninarum TaxID=1646 RepID=Q5UB42_RENSA|nr:putative ABC transporter permease [Renibacterium salmoninarum]